jgi:hypothetical protein
MFKIKTTTFIVFNFNITSPFNSTLTLLVEALNHYNHSERECHDIIEILLKVALNHYNHSERECHDIIEILLKVALNHYNHKGKYNVLNKI